MIHIFFNDISVSDNTIYSLFSIAPFANISGKILLSHKIIFLSPHLNFYY